MIIPSLSLQRHSQHVDHATAAIPIQSQQFNETREMVLKLKMLALAGQKLGIGATSLGLDRAQTGLRLKTQSWHKPVLICLLQPSTALHRVGVSVRAGGSCASPGIAASWDEVAKQVHQYPLILEATFPAHEHGQEVQDLQLGR